MIAQGLSLAEVFHRFLIVRDKLVSGIHIDRPGALAEKELMHTITELWPDRPILFKWTSKRDAEQYCAGLRGLPNEGIPVLPQSFISLNGLDGLPFYRINEYRESAILACRITDRKPDASLVMLLNSPIVFHTGIHHPSQVFMGTYAKDLWERPRNGTRGTVIAVDADPRAPAIFHELVVSKLMQSSDFARTLNLTPGIGAMGVLGGKLSAYIAHNPEHVDIAATATLCLAAGMVVCYLDGSSIPWDRTCFPFPVVFARDQRQFDLIRRHADGYLAAVVSEHSY